MWLHDLISALRSIRRRPGTAILNGLGLVIGLTGFLLLALFVRYELSVDGMHENAEQIVRLNKRVTPVDGQTEFHAITSGAMGPALTAEMPEVEQAVRVLPWFSPMKFSPVKGAPQAGEPAAAPSPLSVERVLFADSTFFSVFGYTLLRGRPDEVLDAPRSVVLTEETSRRFFGTTDVVGRTLDQNGLTYTVTGVAQNPPATTHLPFDAVASWATTVPGTGGLDYGWLNNWITQVTYTYLVLRPGADREALEARLPAFIERNLPQRADEYHLYLQPLQDVYLGSADLRFTRGLRLGNRGFVAAFSIVALLLVLIACINVTNLSTARALERAREVGVRKSLGARPAHLVQQFMTEALLLGGVSTAVAAVAAQALAPAFGALVDRPIMLHGADPWTWAGLFGLAVVTSGLAGAYPAAVLSRYRPAAVLRGSVAGRGRSTVRRVLVGLQLAAAVALIAGTAVIYQQVRYAQTKDLGFDGEILTVAVRGTSVASQYEAFRAEALRHPGIEEMALTETVPGYGAASFEIHPGGRRDETNHQAQAIRLGDTRFFETYGIERVAGRVFSGERSSDSLRGLVVNETLVKSVGWPSPESAIGKRLDVSGEVEPGVVVGVVRDFHVESLRQAISPVVLWIDDARQIASVRLAGENAGPALDHLRTAWQQVEPSEPFAYSVLSERFERYLAAEERLMRLLGVFAGLALAVACLGLFGMVAFAARRRQREIGIRKAVGASVAGIVGLLTREVVVLAVVASALGAPIAYVVTQSWLDAFAYQVEISPAVFVGAGLVTLLGAAGTAALQAVQAARVAPVDVLRSE